MHGKNFEFQIWLNKRFILNQEMTFLLEAVLRRGMVDMQYFAGNEDDYWNLNREKTNYNTPQKQLEIERQG